MIDTARWGFSSDSLVAIAATGERHLVRINVVQAYAVSTAQSLIHGLETAGPPIRNKAQMTYLTGDGLPVDEIFESNKRRLQTGSPIPLVATGVTEELGGPSHQAQATWRLGRPRG